MNPTSPANGHARRPARRYAIAMLAVAATLVSCSQDLSTPETTGTSTAPTTTTPNGTAPTTTGNVPELPTTGIVIPEQVTDVETFKTLIDDYPGYVVTDMTGGSDGYTFRGEIHPNGDMLQQYVAPDGTTATRLMFADGTTYEQDSETDPWFRSTTDNIEEQTLGATFTDFEGDDRIEPTSTGYLVTIVLGGQDSETIELFVDQNRTLTGLQANNETYGTTIDMTLTYPSTLPPLEAPDAYIDQAEADAQQAQENIETATRVITELGAPIAELTVDAVSAAFSGTNLYVNVETSFDPFTVGYANDGTNVELVVSNGLNGCFRTTITDDGTSPVTEDDGGAQNDFGFACGTTILHATDTTPAP